MSEELFEKYLTKSLSGTEEAELKRLLEREEVRRRFVDFLLEWSVTADIARQMALMSQAAAPAEPRPSRRRATGRAGDPSRRSAGLWWIAGIAAAAALLVGLVHLLRTPPEAPKPFPASEAARSERIPAPPDSIARKPEEAPAPPSAPPTPPALPPLPEQRPAPVAPQRTPRPEAPPDAPKDTVPAPPAPPDRGRERPRPSTVAVVHIVETRGEVAVVDEAGRAAAEVGRPLTRGSGLQTGGDGSAAAFAFLDRTRVELGPDTSLREIAEGPAGKRIHIAQGALSADVTRQPAGCPMVFQTPQAEAVVLGTRLKLSVTAGATKLDVLEGRVRLTRSSDKASVEVRAGLQAVARPAGDIVLTRPSRFVKGINLNGEAVTIEGERWISYAEALQGGLSLSPEPDLTVTSVQPRPACDADTSAMLNSAVFKGAANLTLSQSLPNGLYDVSLWVMENLSTEHRSFDIRIEGKTAARDVGARMKLGDWTKLGPYRAVVADGTLTIELLQGKTDPHLMGLTITSAGSP